MSLTADLWILEQIDFFSSNFLFSQFYHFRNSLHKNFSLYYRYQYKDNIHITFAFSSLQTRNPFIRFIDFKIWSSKRVSSLFSIKFNFINHRRAGFGRPQILKFCLGFYTRIHKEVYNFLVSATNYQLNSRLVWVRIIFFRLFTGSFIIFSLIYQ